VNLNEESAMSLDRDAIGDNGVANFNNSARNNSESSAEVKCNLEPFASNQEYLTNELLKLDLILSVYTVSFREKLQQMEKLNPAGQAYISHEEIDFLLARTNPKANKQSQHTSKLLDQIDQLEQQIDQRVKLTGETGKNLPLSMVCHFFSLSYLELQLILLCLAQELEQKYDKIFAYLQDDIARKRPSLELALNLLSQRGENKWSLRALLNDNSQLFRSGILHIIEDPYNPSGCGSLGKMLKLDERILNYILEVDGFGNRLNNVVKKIEPVHCFDETALSGITKKELQLTLKNHLESSKRKRQNLIINLYGSQASEQVEVSHAACAEISTKFLLLDMQYLSNVDIEWNSQIHDCLKESLLQQLPLLIVNIDKYKFSDEGQPKKLTYLFDMIDEYGWLTFVVSNKPCVNETLLRYRTIQIKTINVPARDIHEQRETWRQYCSQFDLKLSESVINNLTNKFSFNGLQIYHLVKSLAMEKTIHRYEQVDENLIENLCRAESNHSLEELAVKVKPHYRWNDIVLPSNVKSHLQSICNQVEHHDKVFNEWGFGEKLAYGKGLSALFSGLPGTGKTMAAQVIANELGLDLYKINLANVISKYIGETEKNLEKIFQSAEHSNSILLFDECDAIFGKRTEVSDSHDRYANIEVSFLLQKMEEYCGIVLLTTNQKKNMDDAFVRRIRFIVEFPFPDRFSREEIWRCHFPRLTPVVANVDFSSLAEKYSISGGSIKNIVLNAAFLAANDGCDISIEHIIESTRTEFEKIGKLTCSFS